MDSLNRLSSILFTRQNLPLLATCTSMIVFSAAVQVAVQRDHPYEEKLRRIGILTTVASAAFSLGQLNRGLLPTTLAILIVGQCAAASQREKLALAGEGVLYGLNLAALVGVAGQTTLRATTALGGLQGIGCGGGILLLGTLFYLWGPWGCVIEQAEHDAP